MSDNESEARKGEREHLLQAREAILEAALPEIPFDGWSEGLLRRAVAASGVSPDLAKLAFPRGAIDLAGAMHRKGDAEMTARYAALDKEGMRIRDKITAAVRLRLEIAGENEEAVRRAASFFALPMHAGEAARLTWGTADAMWNAVGDDAADYNWYTKRLTLSGVYTSVLMCWLGDQDPEKAATWRFLDRRISDVMSIEKAKAQLRKNPLARLAFAGPKAALSLLRAPRRAEKPGDLPVGFPGRF